MKSLLFLLFVLPLTVFAGRTFVLEIVVIDELSLLPLADAVVHLDGDLNVVISNESGQVRLNDCRRRKFTVYASHPEYHEKEILVKKEHGKVTRLIVKMQPVKEKLDTYIQERRIIDMNVLQEKLASIDTNLIPACRDGNSISELSWDAQFPGGNVNLIYFISHVVEYPKYAQEIGDQGRVYVSAIIDYDGSVTEIVIARGISQLLDEEAKRVFKKMPKWIPAYCNGRPVPTRITMPIGFVLN